MHRHRTPTRAVLALLALAFAIVAKAGVVPLAVPAAPQQAVDHAQPAMPCCPDDGGSVAGHACAGMTSAGFCLPAEFVSILSPGRPVFRSISVPIPAAPSLNPPDKPPQA